MSTFYRHGPKDKWDGVVEVLDDGNRYIYHREWPIRSSYESSLGTPISTYLNGGWWALDESLNAPKVDSCL